MKFEAENTSSACDLRGRGSVAARYSTMLPLSPGWRTAFGGPRAKVAWPGLAQAASPAVRASRSVARTAPVVSDRSGTKRREKRHFPPLFSRSLSSSIGWLKRSSGAAGRAVLRRCVRRKPSLPPEGEKCFAISHFSPCVWHDFVRSTFAVLAFEPQSPADCATRTEPPPGRAPRAHTAVRSCPSEANASVCFLRRPLAGGL